MALLLSLICWSDAAAQNSSSDDFANKSIEELMNVDVTSVSRKEQKLSKTPAAVYVLTHEMIQRSSATTIPDLLRMVPGVQVAQVEANRWAISVRGFNDIYSNKLLVLVDGRTVYTPTFSGVYWNQIDVPLDTIERIEVVRGPGGTVWGANAVNGVISIITENSSDTQGTRITAGAGSFQTGDYEARLGGKLGHLGTYRAFGDYQSFGNLPLAQGGNGHDGWNIGHGGFRADINASTKDTLTFEGDLFRTDGGQTLALSRLGTEGTMVQPLNDHGFDVMGRWTRTHSDTSQSSLQIYGSQYSRLDTGLTEQVSTVDIDFQNHTSYGSRNDVVWGLGYRFNSDNVQKSSSLANNPQLLAYNVQFVPPAKSYSLFDGFLQDELSLTDKLALTIGTKLEHNAFSGFEYEPSARLAWTPNNSSTLWMAASKAVRQPSRLDTALQFQFPLIYLSNDFAMKLQVLGNPHLQAETVRTYEFGYRIVPSTRVSFDLSGFYSFYRDLQSGFINNPTVTQAPGSLVLTLPIVYGNGLQAQNYGAEASATWNVMSRWKLSPAYSWVRTRGSSPVELSTSLGSAFDSALPTGSNEGLGMLSTLTVNRNALATAPQHQFNVQSYLDLSSKISFDASFFYVGCLDELNVPAYTRVDAHLAYKLRKGVELSIVGQNLLRGNHPEFSDMEQAIHTLAERNIFGRIVWSF